MFLTVETPYIGTLRQVLLYMYKMIVKNGMRIII